MREEILSPVPDIEVEDEDCVVLQYSGLWDVGCSTEKAGFICQKRGEREGLGYPRFSPVSSEFVRLKLYSTVLPGAN